MEETSVIEKLFSEAEATLNKLSEAMDKREDNARTISGLELFMRRYSNLETPSAAKSGTLCARSNSFSAVNDSLFV
jgi:hypothetical protein